MTTMASNNASFGRFKRAAILLFAACGVALSIVNMVNMEMTARSFSMRSLFIDHAVTTTTETKLPSSRMALELENSSPRFYIYTDRNITQDKPSRVAPVYRKRYGHEADYELAVVGVLKNHSLRTYDPDQADVFIVPTPTTSEKLPNL
jgi:hypothetical protein